MDRREMVAARMTAAERARLELGAALGERTLSELLRRGGLREAERQIASARQKPSRERARAD